MSILQKLEMLLATERAIPEPLVEKEVPDCVLNAIAAVEKIIRLFWLEPADEFTRYQISSRLSILYALDSRWDINGETGRPRIHVTGKTLPNTTLSFTV